jgi:hypothetical protein
MLDMEKVTPESKPAVETEKFEFEMVDLGPSYKASADAGNIGTCVCMCGSCFCACVTPIAS